MPCRAVVSVDQVGVESSTGHKLSNCKLVLTSSEVSQWSNKCTYDYESMMIEWNRSCVWKVE